MVWRDLQEIEHLGGGRDKYFRPEAPGLGRTRWGPVCRDTFLEQSFQAGEVRNRGWIEFHSYWSTVLESYPWWEGFWVERLPGA